jgi:D-glycero-D-manno-heptose 1,7-bisphosphate phosphatase
MRRAVFLDRDGVLNEDRGYVFRREDLRFIPGSIDAVRLLNEAGYLVFVVSNQSGIGRGYYGESDLRALEAHIDEELAHAGAHIDRHYHCPHAPAPDGKLACSCRKPGIGMFERATQDFDIVQDGSWVVGDKPSDMQFATNAGLRGILVVGGASVASDEGVLVAPDLQRAVSIVLGATRDS